jgi:hypothetical protein
MKLVAKIIKNKNNHIKMFTAKFCQIEKANFFFERNLRGLS